MHHLSDPARRAAYDTSLVPPQQPPLVAAAPTAPASNFYGKWKTPTFFAAPTGPKSSTNPNAQPTKQKKAKWSNRASPYSTLASPPQPSAASQAAAAAASQSSSPWWNQQATAQPAPVAQAYSFQCPGCHTTLQVNLDPNQVGSQKVSIKCPHCQCVNEAVVQAQAAAPAGAQAPAAPTEQGIGYAPSTQPQADPAAAAAAIPSTTATQVGADPSSSENDKKRKIEDPGDPNEVFYVEESTRPIPNPPQPVQVPEMPSAPVMQNPYAGMPYALPDTPVNEAATEAIAGSMLA